MSSSLHPQPYIPYGAPGYDAANPIATDGFPQSVGEWVNGFPEFDKSVEIKPPLSVVQAFGGGGSTPNHCRLAIAAFDGDMSRLWLTADGGPGGLIGHRFMDFPPRVIEGLHLTEFLQRFPQAYGPSYVASLTAETAHGIESRTVTAEGVSYKNDVSGAMTHADCFIEVRAVRAALELPKGTRRTYANLRAALERVMGAWK